MRVAHGPDVGAHFVDQQVHRQFRRCPLVGQRLAVHVGQGQTILGHSPLAGHRRGREHGVIIEPITDIAVRRHNVAAFVQQSAYLDDQFSGLRFVHKKRNPQINITAVCQLTCGIGFTKCYR